MVCAPTRVGPVDLEIVTSNVSHRNVFNLTGDSENLLGIFKSPYSSFVKEQKTGWRRSSATVLNKLRVSFARVGGGGGVVSGFARSIGRDSAVRQIVPTNCPTICTHLLNDCGRLSPWNRLLVPKLIFSHLVKKFPHILWNPGFPYCVHDSSPHVPTLSRFNPFHCPSSCSRAVLVLSCLRLGLPSVLFLQFCPPKPVSVSAVPLTCHMPRPSHYS